MWSAYHGHRIYLDANAIIYALETEFSDTEISRVLLDDIDRRLLDVVTSEITIAEVLVKPIAKGDRSAVAGYEKFFSADGSIRLVPVSRTLIEASAEVSASTKMKLPDAIHVATAQALRCDYFLTHDERLGRGLPEGLLWLHFSDISP